MILLFDYNNEIFIYSTNKLATTLIALEWRQNLLEVANNAAKFPNKSAISRILGGSFKK